VQHSGLRRGFQGGRRHARRSQLAHLPDHTETVTGKETRIMQSAEKPANTRLDPRCLELQPPREPGELRQMVREASRALAFLDVVRLEELAISCQKLTSDPGSLSP